MLQLVDQDRQRGVNRVNSIGDGPWDNTTIVRVQNESGDPVSAGDALALGGPLFRPRVNLSQFLTETVLIGVKPQPNLYEGRAVVLLEPLAPGAIGRAAILGVVPVNLYAPNDPSVSAYRANIRPEHNMLMRQDGKDGYPILWLDSVQNIDENGRRWALIQLHQAPYRNTEVDADDDGSNCSPTECIDYPSTSGPAVASCPSTYTLHFGDFSCCTGVVELLANRTLEAASAGRWLGPWFDCPGIGIRCGTARWRWRTGFRQVNCASTWRWTQINCEGSHHWRSVFDSGSGQYVWQWMGTTCNCDGTGLQSDYMPPVAPSIPATNSVPDQYLPCIPVEPFKWKCDSSFLPEECGTCGQCANGTFAGPPAGPPADPNDPSQTVVTYQCQVSVPDPEETGWELIQSCRCGIALPPDRDGLFDGEELTTPCVNSEPTDGYGGYSGPPRVRFELAGEDAETGAEVRLLRGTDILVRWRPIDNRPWCCRCNSRFRIVVDDCVWPCAKIPEEICVRPKGGGLTCNTAAASYAVSVDNVTSTTDGNPCGEHIETANGVHVMDFVTNGNTNCFPLFNNSEPTKGCVWLAPPAHEIAEGLYLGWGMKSVSLQDRTYESGGFPVPLFDHDCLDNSRFELFFGAYRLVESASGPGRAVWHENLPDCFGTQFGQYVARYLMDYVTDEGDIVFRAYHVNPMPGQWLSQSPGIPPVYLDMVARGFPSTITVQAV